ncbi:MAG: tetratricopeptide repeat protein, partial [Gemmataceae bacterium]|nr:tetratricopeptide repeat protein [Gemmataceae bacterium]
MNARLNIRAAVVVLVVLAAAGGAVAGINRWQVRRTAGGLLDLAAAAEEQGRPDRAARLVERYLQLVPGDADARARLATLQESLARDAKGLAAACEGYEEVLVQDPGRADLRARLARLYARRGMLPETRAQLTALKAEASADPELVFLLAACHNTAGEAGPAEALFRRAVDLDPKSVERAAGLAVFLRRQAAKAGDPAARAAAERQAGEVIDRLVAASPDDP